MTVDLVSYAHLETDASVDPARTRAEEDGSVTRFAGGGVVVRSISMRLLRHQAVPFGFVRSASEAGCRALLAGLRIAKGLGATTVRARVDSIALVRALDGTGTLRTLALDGLGDELASEIQGLAGFRILWTASLHRRTRGDGVPSADYLARKAAGLPTRTELSRVRRRRV